MSNDEVVKTWSERRLALYREGVAIIVGDGSKKQFEALALKIKGASKFFKNEEANKIEVGKIREFIKEVEALANSTNDSEAEQRLRDFLSIIDKDAFEAGKRDYLLGGKAREDLIENLATYLRNSFALMGVTPAFNFSMYFEDTDEGYTVGNYKDEKSSKIIMNELRNLSKGDSKKTTH